MRSPGARTSRYRAMVYFSLELKLSEKYHVIHVGTAMHEYLRAAGNQNLADDIWLS